MKRRVQGPNETLAPVLFKAQGLWPLLSWCLWFKVTPDIGMTVFMVTPDVDMTVFMVTPDVDRTVYGDSSLQQ